MIPLHDVWSFDVNPFPPTNPPSPSDPSALWGCLLRDKPLRDTGAVEIRLARIPASLPSMGTSYGCAPFATDLPGIPGGEAARFITGRFLLDVSGDMGKIYKG